MRREALAVLVIPVAAALALVAGACRRDDPNAGRPDSARGFPRAERLGTSDVATAAATEARRDAAGEANSVMNLARIAPGMTVADIGAGEGYYTVRLSPRVGKAGRVLAEDIDRAALQRLGDRVTRERLDNVSIKQGNAADPQLPVASFDRIFLVHVYDEVEEPYAFLWHLRPALRPGGQVIVVERDEVGRRRGIPTAMLFCEFAAVGFRLSEFVRKPELTGYFARFEAVGAAPAPSAITPCHDSNKTASRIG